MSKAEGIYSPALRTRTVGTHKAPSRGQHKAMIKAEGVKYKGLTNKEIIAKAKKSGDFKTILKKYKEIGITEAGVLAILGIELASRPKEDKKRKERTKSRLAQRTGNQYIGEYSKGGGVRKSKYSL